MTEFIQPKENPCRTCTTFNENHQCLVCGWMKPWEDPKNDHRLPTLTPGSVLRECPLGPWQECVLPPPPELEETP